MPLLPYSHPSFVRDLRFAYSPGYISAGKTDFDLWRNVKIPCVTTHHRRTDVAVVVVERNEGSAPKIIPCGCCYAAGIS